MTPATLSISAALRAAVISQAAYGIVPYVPASPGDRAMMVDGMKQRLPVDVQCLVCRESDRLIVVFRGTDDRRKFLSDADILFHDIGDGMKVHAGAWRLLDAIWPTLLFNVQRNAHLPVYVDGHSLGGMLARLFCLRLARDAKIIAAGSITFGEPRSLNAAAARYYESLGIPTQRWVDASDIVPRLPLTIGSRRHVGDCCYIYPDGSIALDQPWWYRVLPDLMHIGNELIYQENAPIGDHGIQIYIAKLKAWHAEFAD